jgi:hypothetical protein
MFLSELSKKLSDLVHSVLRRTKTDVQLGKKLLIASIENHIFVTC